MKNNWSRFVLTIWVIVAFIVAQSYTASLASMLTMQRLQPSFVDVNQLRMNDCYVGYLENSYVRELLIGQLNFKKTRLRHYASPDEYHHALSKGSKNGGVDAVFDEIPYLKLFLAKYCSRYTTVGPTYKSDGWSFVSILIFSSHQITIQMCKNKFVPDQLENVMDFLCLMLQAFPVGSPLVPYMSRAILNVTEDHKKMQEMELKYFSYRSKCHVSSSISYESTQSLSAFSFGGLFIVMALALVFLCLIFLVKSGYIRTCLLAML